MIRKEIENKLGLTRKEIRYLEDIGIIQDVNKIQGKEYDYPNDDVKRFYLVRFFKDCGYKTKDIKDVFLKYADEKKIIEESILKMKKQIKKLNENIKLAKAMLKNDFMSFSDYSLIGSRLYNNYSEFTLGYILTTELFNSNNIEDIYPDYISKSIEKVIDKVFDDIFELDEMIDDKTYSKNELQKKSILILENIIKIFGFYSRGFLLGFFNWISKDEELFSKKLITFLINTESDYYSKYKEKAIEYKIECAEIDLMIILNDYSYKDDIVQDKVLNYINLYRKIIKEEYLVKIMVSVFNRPESIGVIMNSLNINENKAKIICDDFLKAIEYYYEKQIHSV